jgi:hypothetical protein
MHKAEGLEPVPRLPDEVDIEELIYHLYLLEKLTVAEVNIAARRTLLAREVWERVRVMLPVCQAAVNGVLWLR